MRVGEGEGVGKDEEEGEEIQYRSRGGSSRTFDKLALIGATGIEALSSFFKKLIG